MARSFLLLIALLWTAVMIAQQPRQFTFTHYDRSNGLFSNQIFAIQQDEKGYIWMGTTNGLIRFDGTRYKLFKADEKDSTTLPFNAIAQLSLDANKQLWLRMTNGKLGYFNTRNFRFTESKLQLKDSSARRNNAKLVTDNKGSVFLLVDGKEVLAWNKRQNLFAPAPGFLKGHEDLKLTDMVHQPGTPKYWMALQGSGLAVYNSATGQLSYPGHNTENEPAIEAYSRLDNTFQLFFDSRGRLWFVNWHEGFPGIYCYDVRNRQPVLSYLNFKDALRTYHEINGFMEQADGTIWINGSLVFGYFKENEKRFELIPPGNEHEKSIDYKVIKTLYEDKEHNIWVGTGNNGVFRFNPSMEYFTCIQHRNKITGKKGEGNPLSFMEDKDGSVLVGVWGDGLYRYDKDFKNIPLGIKGIGEQYGIAVWDMCQSADSNIAWFACQPGIYKYDKQKRAAQYFNPAILANKTVREIAEDKKGNLWLGMQSGGLVKWDATKGRTRFEDGLSVFTPVTGGSQVNKIIVDSRGLIWVGTGLDGAFVIDPVSDSVLQHFHEQAAGALRLPEEGVSSILEYDDSLMLISTVTRVIVYNRLRNTKRFLGTSELLAGFVASMQKDRDGNVWIGTTANLCRVDIRTRIFASFNRYDGITNDYFILNSANRLADGRLLFGTSSQFVVFDPRAIIINTPPPSITITDFKVMNQSLLVDSLLDLKQVVLGHMDNSVSIDFSPMAFHSPHLIQYKLEGIDKDWIIADRNMQALYAYLPTGSFNFMFRTMGIDGKTTDSSTHLLIKVSPPFWGTWWFYGALVLLGGGFLFWLDKERMKRKEAVLQMRTEIAGSLHEQVNTALNNINVLSEMARLKAGLEPEKSKEFIEQIHSKSHNMIIAMDDMLWSISPENDSMQKTVERMQEYIEGLNSRHGIQIEMLVDEHVKSLKLDMHLRHEAFLLFKESINGLLKAEVSKCTIHVGLDRSTLLYTLQFGTDNCDIMQLNNLLQRQDLARRLRAINARLDIELHKTNSVLECRILI